MADRSVVVRLIASVGGYVAGMRTASASTAQFAAQARRSGAAANAGMAAAGASAQRASGRFGALEAGAGAAGVSLRTLGLGGAAAAAVGIGSAVKVAADFEKKMATVRANVDLGTVSFDKLTEAVKTQGTQYGFSALESADATDDLAKAGLNAKQIIGGGLTGALTLAAAGNISAGDAAETAATAMTMFKLSAKDIPHIADLLAAGADKSTASVSSLSEGLMEGGSLAKLMGVSIEDTTAVLAEFDQSGLKGAKAGNALKTMFQNLLDPTKKQQKTMDELGLSFFDANGKFIGLAGVAGQLQEKMHGLDDKTRNAALSVLFGARSIQAANILYKDGADGVQDWQNKVNEAGFAAENAAKKQDSLAGDLNKAKSAAVNFAIDIGGRLTPMLRQVTQFATNTLGGLTKLTGGLLDLGSAAGGATLGKLPSSMQTAALAMGVAAAASKLLGGRLDGVNQRMANFGRGTVSRVRTFGSTMRDAARATGTMVDVAGHGRVPMGRFGSAVERVGRAYPSVARLQGAFVNAAAGARRLPRTVGAAAASMSLMRSSARGIVGALGGPFGAALTAGVIGLSLWQKHQQDAAQKVAEHKAKVAELTEAIKKDGNELGKASASQIAKNLVDSDTIGIAKEMGISQEQLTRAWMGQPSAIKAVNGALDESKAKTLLQRDAQGRLTQSANEHMAAIDKVRTSMEGQVKDTGNVIAKNNEYAQSQRIAGDALKESKAPADEYASAQKKLASAQKEASKAAADLKKGIDDVSNAFLEGQANEDGFEAAIDAATASLKENGKTLDKHTEKGRANRKALRDIATAGLQYADSLAKEGKSAQTVAGQITRTRDAYVQAAIKMGYTRGEAEKLAAAFIKMPKKVTTKVEADITLAKANLEAAETAVKKYGHNLEDLPKSVQTAIIAKGGKNAKEQIDKLDTSVRQLPGSASVKTDAPGANGSMLRLKNVSAAAVDANGKSVSIPVDTPKQAQALRALMKIDGAAVSADHKSVTIPSSTPLSARTIAELKKIDGVAVTANGKSVSISTSSPGAFQAAQDILSAGSAADRVNGKRAYIKIVTDKIVNHVDNFTKTAAGWLHADGAVYGAHGTRKMAHGGVARPAMIANRAITWAEAGPEAYLPLGRDKRNARTDRILRVSADILGYDVIKRANGGIDGMRPGWDRAMPVSSSRVVVQSGGGGAGLTDSDRALMRQYIQTSQRVLASMPAAVESGLSGRRTKDAQSAHLARNRGGY